MPDKDYRLLPLSFERGINEQVEDSMLPVGALSRLRNWDSSPSGELRTRYGWSKGSTTSAPASGSRKAMGIGYFTRQTMPSIVQQSTVAVAQNPSGSSVNPVASWPTATTTGNLLLYVGVLTQSDGSSSVSAPSGWTTTALAATTDTISRPRIVVYAIENAASRSGAEAALVWSSLIASGNETGYCFLLEIANAKSSSAVDVTVAANGAATTTHTSGATATTNQAAELALAVLVGNANGGSSYSGWLNGFTEIVDSNQATSNNRSGWVGAAVANLTSTQTVTGTATAANSGAFAAAVITIKSFNAGAYSDNVTRFVAANNNGGTAYDIYAVDRSTISSATWTNPGNLTVSDSASQLLATATGFGKTFLSNNFTGTIYYYDGSNLTTIPSSYAGRAITVHKNRLWSAGTVSNPGRLWYSNINDSFTWSSTQYIDILRDSGEVIEDIVPFEDLLVIGTRTSLFLLAGSGPDTFSLKRLPIGGVAPGRSLLPTPYGIVAAGRKHIWLIANEAVNLISRPVGTSYGMTGNWVTTSFLYDEAYINDAGSGTTWVINMQTGAWREERVDGANEYPVQIYQHDDLQVFGPKTATTGSLLNYRTIPGSTRTKDFTGITETYSAYTGTLFPVGPEYRMTPRYLFLRVRQRGTAATGLTVTPVYNGTAGTAKTYGPESAAGVYRYRFDLGNKQGIDNVLFRFDQVAASTDTSMYDVEEATLGFYEETVR